MHEFLWSRTILVDKSVGVARYFGIHDILEGM